MDNRLGSIIKDIRVNKLKMTQKEMSEKMEISVVYISFLEKGKKIPGKKFLKSIYELLDTEPPEEVMELLKERNKLHKRDLKATVDSDVLYNIDSSKLSVKKLVKKLKKDDKNLTTIYLLMRAYLHEGNKKEAKELLLKSILNIEEPYYKKWLEASYYELEGNTNIAIELMKESVVKFERQMKSKEYKDQSIKSEAIFYLSTLIFNEGRRLYNQNDKQKAIEMFNNSAFYHEKLKKGINKPYYQMDYASNFLWLALLDIEPEKNWELYLENAKKALFLSYYEKFSEDRISENGLYSKQYVLSTISFMVRAYAQLAMFKKNKKERLALLQEGEFLLTQHIPIAISPSYEEYYRFYFNASCFYSISAEIYQKQKIDNKKLIVLCNKSLQEAFYGEISNTEKLFGNELKSSEGLKFFRDNSPDEYTKLKKQIAIGKEV